MFIATDVQYFDDGTGRAAGIGFWHTADAGPAWTETHVQTGIAPYEPGAFFKRELPCLLPLLQPRLSELTVIIVDGHVDLGPDRPGLGRHLLNALPQWKGTVVGVAKNDFVGASPREVLRGGSVKPLYVTAAGPEADKAEQWVREMHGPFRFPTLLKLADQIARGNV